MIFKGLLLLLVLWDFKITSLLLLTTNLSLLIFGKQFFAKFLSEFCKRYNKTTDSLKTELFRHLDGIECDKIKILEIGGGSGANFKYMTRPAEILLVDPNPSFDQYFKENKAKYPNLDVHEFIQGYGEDLLEAGIEDSSVDVVVMTLVLCSVQDQKKCLKEIKRVLKPGGKFLFMEHIAASEGSLLRKIQNLMMFGGLWECLVDGCCLDRETDQALVQANFSHLQQDKFDLPKNPGGDFSDRAFDVLRSLIKPHLMGVATK